MRVKAGNTWTGSVDTLELPADWTLTENDGHVTGSSGGSITASTDVTITSKSGGVSGDIIFLNDATEAGRFTGGQLGLGITTGLAAPLHVRIPGAGTIAKFDVNGGSQYYHLNEFGLGAVGDGTTIPYIAVENNTLQDIRIKLLAGTNAQATATLDCSTATDTAHPALWIQADDDIKIVAGNGRAGDRTKQIWLRAGNGTVFADFAGSVKALIDSTGKLVFYNAGSGTGAANLYLGAADFLKTDDSFGVGNKFSVAAAGYVVFAEQTDPGNGSANQARLYSRDNGAGKTQLCVVFPTGAVQVLATEP